MHQTLCSAGFLSVPKCSHWKCAEAEDHSLVTNKLLGLDFRSGFRCRGLSLTTATHSEERVRHQLCHCAFATGTYASDAHTPCVTRCSTLYYNAAAGVAEADLL